MAFPLSGLWRGSSGKLAVQVFRYLVSGTLAFLLDTGLLTLLTESFGRQHLLWWTAIGFCAGLLLTYLLSIRWVFDERRLRDKSGRELGIFAAIAVTGLGLTELLMWLFAGRMGLHYLPAKGVTTVLVFCWNFIAKKTLLFSHHHKDEK